MYRDQMRGRVRRGGGTEHGQRLSGEPWEPALPPAARVLACLLVCLLFGLAAWV